MSRPPGRHTDSPPLERSLNLPTDVRAVARRIPPPVPPRVPPGVRRELIILGILLLCGLVAAPLLTWVAGNRWLGPYTHEQNQHAGPLALLQDYFAGLLHGSAVFWLVALGPTAFVLLVRLLIRLVRISGSREEEDEPDAGPERRAR
jgi:hypothetical protein